ncbi:outer membrane receptor protein involved in Fe transport [Altererythrobacter atlanticus]|uniref:TonB-dependent receptor n=1 Tax=Croceibacterium atlanticum TaxID=1267766 RepID=UPI0006B3A3EE|nr:TonB-dependent receptor [Croceibacterium atlanticum]MBB5732753.1 outer membrane receptor protein involved in Fe transport [Croceibacterium atlanticum]
MPAYAQDDLSLDEGAIIVTAQGRREASEDVPISLQTFSDEEIGARDLHDLREIAPFVPGFYVESQYPTTPSIVIRGISSDTADLSAEPRVSVYRDGVYVSRPQSAMFELFDIERVEVLKGPQSTLFGRSALTGAVSIIQNKADPADFDVTGTVGGGNLGAYLAQGVVNLTLSGSSALRIAGLARNRDGYVRNLAGGAKLNGNRARALRGSLHFDLASGGKIDLLGNAQWDRFSGLSYKSGVFAPTDPVTGTPLGDLDPSSPAFLDTAPGFPDERLGGRRKLEGMTLLYEQPIGEGWKISAIGAWNRFRAQFAGDVDGFAFDTATTGEESENRQWSGDLRLHYQPADGLSAFIGASFADESGSQDILLQVDERDLLALQTGFLDRTNPVPLPEAVYSSSPAVTGQLQGIAAASGFALDGSLALALANNMLGDHSERLLRSADNQYREIFAGMVFQPAERWKFELGLRYTDERKRSGIESTIYQRSVLAGVLGALTQPASVRDPLLQALAAPGAAHIPASASYPVPNFGLLYQEGNRDERELEAGGFSWRASAIYEASPDFNLYAIYARGRRPEVLSTQPPLSPGGEARFSDLASEVVDSIELGFKLNSGPFRLEAAGFYYDYRHFQTEVLQGTTLVSMDAGKASSHGAELTARYAVMPAFTLFATYGYTRARFGAGLYDGNHVRLSPDHSLSFGANMALDLGIGELTATPTLNWRSRVYFDNSNGDLSAFSGAFLRPLAFEASQQPYALAALHVGFEPDNSPLRLQAHIENLFDQDYVRDLGTGSVSFGLPSYVAGAPRSILFTASISLGGR